MSGSGHAGRDAERLLVSQRDMALALAAEYDLRRGAMLCLRCAIRDSGLDCGGVYLVNHTAETVDLLCHHALSPAFVRAALSFPKDSDRWRMVTRGRPVYARYCETGLTIGRADRQEGIKAICIIPILHRKRAIGCLNVASHTLDEVPAFSRHRLEMIAAEIGNAIARLQAEEALQQSEQRYRSLLENLTVGVFRTSADARGRFHQANQALARIFGFRSIKDLRAVHIQDLYHDPRDRAAFLRTLRSRRVVDHALLRFWRRNGQPFWGSLTGQGHFESGRLVWVDGVIEDVTERKAAQEALARAHEQLLQAREDERRWLAGELHDSLGQGLAALSLFLHDLLIDARELPPDSPLLIGVRRCAATCSSLLEEARNISRGLYPPTLESMGLISALHQLEQASQAARLQTALTVSPGARKLRFSREVEIALFRITQEAVNNAIRHSGGRRIRIQVTCSPRCVRLTVRDDGSGFDPSRVRHGLGLTSMQGRAQSIGADLKISRRAGWTEVAVRLPRPHRGA